MNKTLPLLFVSILLIFQGSVPFSEVIADLLASSWNPLLHERIPRWIVLVCTGASLATAGAAMQALFQNPLASPSILGMSLGGSLSAFLVFLWGVHLTFPPSIPCAAFLGCVLSLCFVYSVSKKTHAGTTPYTLLMVGLAFSTFLAAIHGALLYVFRDAYGLVQSWMEWEAGTTLDRTWTHVHQQLPLTCIGLAVVWRYRQELNILSLGDEEALTLGVEVKKVRFRIFLSIALLISGSLASCGIVPFFGLALPHILRHFGADHRVLIPHCILFGATCFVSIDYVLRACDITALSIGQVSALFGGLFFLILILKAPRELAGHSF